MATDKLTIEICVEGTDGLVAAQKGGADRVELCASLIEGGLTPSFGVVHEALRLSHIPFHVIVRPRGGDFLYSKAEFAAMLADVTALRELGVAGIVIGCLTEKGDIDEARTTALVEAARPMSVTCHRAFDMTRDYRAAVEALVRCGVDRVLTSGQRDTAVQGMDILKDTVQLAAGRLVIMACGELDANNIAAVRAGTGVTEMHFAAPKTAKSPMAFRNPHVGMGGDNLEREYELTQTDSAAVARTIAAARD
ncbi:copper homeostasis protein CutC [Devosia rhodophyticola]|uniref:PF03932 family protein CutC n=1 Tax=Devosia rhodophyticola TaxID=3026423 RepID=A0ABY7Z0M6_9HYPH|nr:copper homeostasis protein CutC [Devosia rhodophyticola]WDR07139.1 copper homeostasis protein CutC [Devosia rhodophyticola]